MTMHLIRGVRATGSKKRPNRKPGWKDAQASHNEWLRSMGIDPDKKPSKKSRSVNSIPDYKTQSSNTVPTSDKICGHGSIKEQIKYTGTEIAGIVTTHKSNLMPVRKDNKNAAKDAASMRR